MDEPDITAVCKVIVTGNDIDPDNNGGGESPKLNNNKGNTRFNFIISGTNTVDFTDVKKDKPYAQAVGILASKGVLGGYFYLKL